jgi:hypothetical protein
MPQPLRACRPWPTGYDGAGIGIHVPFKPTDGRRLGVDNRTYNQLLRAMRALGERGFALLDSYLGKITSLRQRRRPRQAGPGSRAP